VLGFARSVVFLINVMNDATSIPVAAPPPGISSYLAAFLSSWSARSPVPFRIVFANGAEFHAGNAEPAFTLRFRTRRAEFLPALFGHTALLEAYFAGELDVDGNFAMAFRTAMDAKSDGHLVYQGSRYEGLTVNFLELLYSAGGKAISDDGKKATIDSPEAKSVLEFM